MSVQYCKIVTTVKLSQIDNAFSRSENLFVKIIKLWICHERFCIFLHH